MLEESSPSFRGWWEDWFHQGIENEAGFEGRTKEQ
jgi:hypothetical protein